MNTITRHAAALGGYEVQVTVPGRRPAYVKEVYARHVTYTMDYLQARHYKSKSSARRIAQRIADGDLNRP